MSREGGTGADIRYVTPADNRGAGATMGNALEAPTAKTSHSGPASLAEKPGS